MAPHLRARYARAVARRIFHFDSYSIDLATRELRHAGQLVVLSPKVFDCIAWLIEHRDRAVGRDELGAAIWGKADVADTQLVQAILKARRAIGDTGDEQRAIRTIPRFGYRWVAELDAEEPAAPETALAAPPLSASPSAGPPQATVARRAHPFRARWSIAAFVLLALVAAGTTRLYLRQAQTRPAERDVATAQRNIAVLPAAIGAERDWTWLRLGVMDLVAERLRDAGLAVVPSDNVVSLLRDRGEAETAERIVREAIAPQWVVAPVVRRNASGWVVSIELRNVDGQPRAVEVADADPVVAARRAVGGLLPALGRTHEPSGEAADPLVSHIRAALLGNDFVTAQRQLEAAAPAQRDLPEVRLLQGQTDFGLGRFELARERFTQLLDALGEEGDPLLRARAEKGRAASLVRLSDLRGAERDYEAALALLGNREPALEGQIYSGRGVARALRGEDDEGAMADFGRARIALQLAGDTLAMAGVEMNEGALKGRRGRPDEALASFRAAEQHFARFDSRSNLAAALANQIEAHLALLDPARALEVGERGQVLATRLADPSVRRLLAYWHANALSAVGRLAEADEQLDALIRAPDAVDDVGIRAMSRSRKATLALATGRPRNAAALAREALAGTAAGPWKDVRSEAWLTLIRALRSEGNAAEAAAEMARFSDWARDVSDPAVVVTVRLAQAEQAWGDHRDEVAASTYAEALALAERFTVPAEIARVAVSWGTTLIADGRLEAAGPVVGRLARWSGSDYSCALLQARLYRALGQRPAWQAALAQARSLAGERALPATVTAEPDSDALALRP
ncbi:MAG: winged helix-turn-helix domain-containing protein [Dokdonella sp.]|nr:winged helix-turn-helix domain-containing protein [Dokdonella sp.]MBO9662849.1 winged helix-turn-helix domain-containing protein [Dokdonella sp.]